MMTSEQTLTGKDRRTAWMLLLILFVAALAAASPGVAAEPAGRRPPDADERMKRTLTVITHGYQPPPPIGTGKVPAWANEIATGLKKRGVKNVMVVDWVETSRIPAPGWAEAVADEAAARIANFLLHQKQATDLHLLGHSRGAVVNSEIHRRLLWYTRRSPALHERLDRIYVTMLDPHPCNGRVGFFAAKGFGGQIAKGVAKHLSETACDPNPEVWEGTAFAACYYQRCKSGTINPWGWGTDAPFADQLHVLRDLTDKQCRFKGQRKLIIHTELGNWYAASIAACSRFEENGGLVSGGGYHELCTAILKKTMGKEAAGRAGKKNKVEPGTPLKGKEPASVFNGDFRYGQSRRRIPGWVVEQPLKVTGGRLRLTVAAPAAKNAVEADPEGADGKAVPAKPARPHAHAVTHAPLYLPKGENELAFDVVSAAGKEGTLTVWYVPVPDMVPHVKPVAGFTPGADRDQWIRLRSWNVDQLQPGCKRIGLKTEGETVGTFRLELTAPTGSEASVEVDNFDLVVRRPTQLSTPVPRERTAVRACRRSSRSVWTRNRGRHRYQYRLRRCAVR